MRIISIYSVCILNFYYEEIVHLKRSEENINNKKNECAEIPIPLTRECRGQWHMIGLLKP